MHPAFCVAVLAVALLLVSGPAARAGDDTTLSAWLAQCQNGRQKCLGDLTIGYVTAYEDMGEVCPPANLSEADAAEAELRWLENAAAYNSPLAAGKELDAEWTALHTLWSCSN